MQRAQLRPDSPLEPAMAFPPDRHQRRGSLWLKPAAKGAANAAEGQAKAAAGKLASAFSDLKGDAAALLKGLKDSVKPIIELDPNLPQIFYSDDLRIKEMLINLAS